MSKGSIHVGTSLFQKNQTCLEIPELTNTLAYSTVV